MGEKNNNSNQGGQIRKGGYGNYEHRSHEIGNAERGRHTDRTTSSQPAGNPPPKK